jgi:hypothetical protein
MTSVSGMTPGAPGGDVVCPVAVLWGPTWGDDRVAWSHGVPSRVFAVPPRRLTRVAQAERGRVVPKQSP